MTQSMRLRFLLGSALLIVPLQAHSQDQPAALRPTPLVPHHPLTVAAVHPITTARDRLKRAKLVRRVAPQPAPVQAAAAVAPPPKPSGLIAAVTLADIGFVNGLHFANLGGHRELYMPIPDDADVTATSLTLVIDDFAAHEAKRNLIVQINDRTVTAIALDGQGRGRSVQVPLGGERPKDGYIKLAFLYSGAATPDHYIDVRYVGDSVTVRPQTAVDIDVGAAGHLDVATTAALMPRDVAVMLPRRHLAESEMAAAITVARARKFAAVPPQPEQVAARMHEADLWILGVARAVPRMMLTHPYRHENFNRLADQFAATVAEQTFGYAVGEHNAAGTVRHQHAVRTGLDGKAKQFAGELVRRAIATHRCNAGSLSHGQSKSREFSSGADPAGAIGNMC
jgi:hypothetical protein